MPAWAAPTVTNVAAAGQTAAQIFQNVKDRLAGQGNVSGTTQAGVAYAAVTGQAAYMALGAVKDSNGNIADVIYDPNGNVFYTIAR